MKSRSVYIVQSQVLSLGPIPFNHDGELRPSFESIFNSKKCFSDMSTVIYDYYRVHTNPILKYWNVTDEYLLPGDFNPIPIKSAPFISNLGQICINTRTAYFKDYAFEKQKYAFLIGKRVRYWDAGQKVQNDIYKFFDNDEEYFGFKPNIPDQRMNNLYFELRPPLNLKADGEGGCKAKGRMFIHIYPSGYIIIQYAISLRGINSIKPNEIMPLVNETKPWRKNNKWIWSSKLGKMSLNELHQKVIDEISISIFNDGTHIKNRTENWHTAYSFVSDLNITDVSSHLFDSKYEEFNTNAYDEKLLSSKQGILYMYNILRERKSVLHSFWRAMAIYEFTILKNQIYSDYIKQLKNDVNHLKEIRLSRFEKYRPENLIKLNLYNSSIPKYIKNLDDTILSASSFYRALYSSISKGIDFDKHHYKLKEILKDWEYEIEKWESPQLKLVSIAKKVLNPLAKFLG